MEKGIEALIGMQNRIIENLDRFVCEADKFVEHYNVDICRMEFRDRIAFVARNFCIFGDQSVTVNDLNGTLRCNPMVSDFIRSICSRCFPVHEITLLYPSKHGETATLALRYVGPKYQKT